jgi:hypothetical protein
VFADAVAATGKRMIISTEPFSLVPNPNQQRFAHFWRTGNDINANWNTILNRIDINDKWQAFAGRWPHAFTRGLSSVPIVYRVFSLLECAAAAAACASFLPATFHSGQIKTFAP